MSQEDFADKPEGMTPEYIEQYKIFLSGYQKGLLENDKIQRDENTKNRKYISILMILILLFCLFGPPDLIVSLNNFLNAGGNICR